MRPVARLLIATAAAGVAGFGMAILVAIVIGVASLSPRFAFLREGLNDDPVFYIERGDVILIVLSLVTAIVTFVIVWRKRR